jgi:iron(III) transport system ATP-binding protein
MDNEKENKNVEGQEEKGKNGLFGNKALIYSENKKPQGVTLKHVSKIYTDPKTKRRFFAVKDSNIEIAPGEFVTLLGPSGCGKTTTLRMIAGFESPDMGEVYIGSENVNAYTPNQRDTAMVFQSYALMPQYNVFDNVAYGLKLRKKEDPSTGALHSLSHNEIHDKVMAMLDLVQLTGMEERMTNQLSGGQQQRVALARALVLNPSVLLFDEPLSNLDAKLRVSMRTEIREIQQRVGITAIYVTHDQSEAMALSDRIIVMNKGFISQIGTPKEIYYHPKNEFVADFIGEVNFLEATINSLSVDAKKTDVQVGDIHFSVDNPGGFKVADEVKLVLRPEAVHVEEKGLLPCLVELSTFMGSYQLYHVKCGEEMIKICEYNPRGKKVFAVGEKGFLNFAPTDCHILPRHEDNKVTTIYLDDDKKAPGEKKCPFSFLHHKKADK